MFPSAPGGLWQALLDQWASYATFAVSVLVIGVVWINHHAILDHIRRVDGNLLFLNLLLLMTVTFIPFPTAMLWLMAGFCAAGAVAILFSGGRSGE